MIKLWQYLITDQATGDYELVTGFDEAQARDRLVAALMSKDQKCLAENDGGILSRGLLKEIERGMFPGLTLEAINIRLYDTSVTLFVTRIPAISLSSMITWVDEDGNSPPSLIHISNDDELDQHFNGVMIEIHDWDVGTHSVPGWECKACGWKIGTVRNPPDHLCPDDGEKQKAKREEES